MLKIQKHLSKLKKNEKHIKNTTTINTCQETNKQRQKTNKQRPKIKHKETTNTISNKRQRPSTKQQKQYRQRQTPIKRR